MLTWRAVVRAPHAYQAIQQLQSKEDVPNTPNPRAGLPLKVLKASVDAARELLAAEQ